MLCNCATCVFPSAPSNPYQLRLCALLEPLEPRGADTAHGAHGECAHSHSAGTWHAARSRAGGYLRTHLPRPPVTRPCTQRLGRRADTVWQSHSSNHVRLLLRRLLRRDRWCGLFVGWRHFCWRPRRPHIPPWWGRLEPPPQGAADARASAAFMQCPSWAYLQQCSTPRCLQAKHGLTRPDSHVGQMAQFPYGYRSTKQAL